MIALPHRPGVETVMNGWLQLLAWPLAGWIAYIFLWYLQFKFIGHPGSVDLFTTLTDWLGFHGHEKFMRLGTGLAELAASILLFVPRVQVLGAAMALCIMTGAIFFHLVSPLGVDPYGDGGILFKEACATWAAAAGILFLRRAEVLAIIAELRRRFLPAT